jgi:alkaline phosphatase D
MQAAGTKVIGVWDDHDYGINDGSKDFSKKHITREIFLDFIEEPAKSPRRLHKNSSIHQDYIIHGQNGFKTHIILLDNRFDFDSKTDDRLGDEQW